MTHRPRVPGSTGRTYAALCAVETSGAKWSRPEHRAPVDMDASQSTPREGDSAVGRTAFAQYLQRIAYAEVERASDALRSDVFALVHPDRPQVRRESSVEEIVEDFEELEHAVRFLELVEDMEGAE